MTQEEKQLLLKDLCARLPYGVKIELTWWVMGEGTCMNTTLESDIIEQLINDEDGDTEIQPYLRPMSSMTDEELSEYEKANDLDTLDSSETLRENMKAKARVRISKWYHGTDWLNAHHFDYRNLIEKGLAIAVTENNNPYEN